MKRSIISAVALGSTVLFAAAACGSSTGSSSSSSSAASPAAGSSAAGSSGGAAADGAGKTVTVWLQSDAEKGWPEIVEQANKRFEEETGATVDVQYQQWANYTTKLDSTFAGSSGIPDVVELGNTQTASYIAAGAFNELTADTFENSSTWLQGLAESSMSPEGSLQAVPYYAGSRVVIYRKDMWDAAGVTAVPTTLDELYAALDKVEAANSADPNFSAFYMPAKNWYAAMSFVYGAGGTIASLDGTSWAGGLSTAEAQQGLAEWSKIATQYSVGGLTKDEADQDAIMAQGHVSAILGNGWEVGAVTDAKTGDPSLADKLSTFPMPGTAPGAYTPSFLGGSDLAVPAKSENSDLGTTWIKIFTDTESQTMLAKYAIPNTTSLLPVYQSQGQANESTGEAAKNTWFVPNTPSWANVEAQNVLPNMLEAIATGKATAAAAAADADAQIATILNAS